MSGKTVQFKMPTSKSADAWVGQGVEPHLSAATAAAAMPAVKMKRFTIDVPQDLHARVKVACAQRGLNMADELRRILEREFPTDVAKS
jgi:predicted DNA binding CopG/RHH family protein